MANKATERPRRYEISNYAGMGEPLPHRLRQQSCFHPEVAEKTLLMLSNMSKGLAHPSAQEAVSQVDWDGMTKGQTVQVEAEHIFNMGLRSGEAFRLMVYVTRVY